MNKSTRKVPEIRFKGFSEDWEQRKLGDVLTVNSGRDYKHLENGNIPVYGTGGYMLSVNESLSDEDAIGIGRKGTIDNPQLLKAPFWTVDTLFYLIPKNKVNLLFCFSLINTILWKKYDESTGVPSLSKATIENIPVRKPEFKEQFKIGILLKKLDDTIALHQGKLKLLKQLKQGYLQNMFPQQGENVPKLRIANFMGNWEQRKLGEFVSIKSGWSPSNFIKSNDQNSQLFIKVDDLNYSTRDQTESYMKVQDNPQFVKMKKGSTIFPKRGAAIMTNKVRILESSGYMDTNMMALEPENIEGKFLYTFIEKTGLYKIADMSTIPQINNKHIEPYNICIPNIDEQEHIGNFFKQLDNTIALHQTKLDKLQTLKQAYLQKMFI